MSLRHTERGSYIDSNLLYRKNGLDFILGLAANEITRPGVEVYADSILHRLKQVEDRN
jgi:hypothetical protein